MYDMCLYTGGFPQMFLLYFCRDDEPSLLSQRKPDLESPSALVTEEQATPKGGDGIVCNYEALVTVINYSDGFSNFFHQFLGACFSAI